MGMSEEALEPCAICNEPTQWIYNISFKAVPVCNICADNITMQNVSHTFAKKNLDNITNSIGDSDE